MDRLHNSIIVSHYLLLQLKDMILDPPAQLLYVLKGVKNGFKFDLVQLIPLVDVAIPNPVSIEFI